MPLFATSVPARPASPEEHEQSTVALTRVPPVAASPSPATLTPERGIPASLTSASLTPAGRTPADSTAATLNLAGLMAPASTPADATTADLAGPDLLRREVSAPLSSPLPDQTDRHAHFAAVPTREHRRQRLARLLRKMLLLKARRTDTDDDQPSPIRRKLTPYVSQHAAQSHEATTAQNPPAERAVAAARALAKAERGKAPSPGDDQEENADKDGDVMPRATDQPMGTLAQESEALRERARMRDREGRGIEIKLGGGSDAARTAEGD